MQQYPKHWQRRDSYTGILCSQKKKSIRRIADSEYKSPRALLHCFTGTLEEAKQVLDRGWSISFSGIITFKKSIELKEVVKYAPIDRVFIETDAPYLAPQTKRGLRNEPSFVVETAEVVAALKGISLEQVAEQTSKNVRSLFSF